MFFLSDSLQEIREKPFKTSGVRWLEWVPIAAAPWKHKNQSDASPGRHNVRHTMLSWTSPRLHALGEEQGILLSGGLLNELWQDVEGLKGSLAL